MLDPAYIRDHVDDVRRALRHRGLDPDKALEDIATLETARRRLIPELEGLKRQQNTSGDEIARAKRQGKDTSDIQEANRARAAQIKQLGVQLDSTEHQRNQALLVLPNLPHGNDKLIPALAPLRLLGPPNLLESVVTTMLVGRDQAYLNQPWVSARTIRVDSTDIGFLDFDISANEIDALYMKGYAATERFLAGWDWDAYLKRFR